MLASSFLLAINFRLTWFRGDEEGISSNDCREMLSGMALDG